VAGLRRFTSDSRRRERQRESRSTSAPRDLANKIEDRTVKIEPSGGRHGLHLDEQPQLLGQDFSTEFYKLDGSFSASDVAFVQFVFQRTTPAPRRDAKVDEISRRSSTTASACP